MDKDLEVVTKESEATTKRDYEKELLNLIESDVSPETLKEELSNYHETDIAEVISKLTREKRLVLYKLLGDEAVSDIFANLDNVEEYIEELPTEKAADILGEMDADDASDVLDELEESKRSEIFELLDEETAKDIELIDSYDDDLIGSRMTTNFVVVKRTDGVKQAMKSVVDQAAENDNISTVYAKNDDGTYQGAFSLRDLVIARQQTPLDDIISTAYPYVYADEKITTCIEELKGYYEDSIPVLNRENKIIGVITSSELVEVVDSELSDDYAKLAGLTAEEDLNEPLFKSVKKRIPWLITLMLLGLVISALIGSFEFVFAAVPILVGFQSLILGLSGNGGTQSLAIAIRVITAEDLSFKQKLKFLFKEFRVGLLNGFIMGALATIICTLYIWIFKDYAFSSSILVGSCVGVATFIALIFASLSGTIIPMIFKKLKIDPAVASGPMITTLNDLLAATVYYGISYIILMQISGIVTL